MKNFKIGEINVVITLFFVFALSTLVAGFTGPALLWKVSMACMWICVVINFIVTVRLKQ